MVNELNYRDYDVPLADRLFDVADDAIQPAPENMLRADPFGRALAPFVPWHNRVFYMPLEGMEIVVHPPWNDPTKGIQSMSSKASGGIVRYEFHRNPLTEIAQTLGNRLVETSDTELSDRRYSARIAHRITIDPVERVKRLGQRFGFVAELKKRQGTRTSWIFTQDGTDFPDQRGAARINSGPMGTTSAAQETPLFAAIQNMLSQCGKQRSSQRLQRGDSTKSR